MESKAKTKNVVIFLVLLSVILVAVIGISFSSFFKKQEKNVKEIVKTGTVSMNYKSEVNGLQLVDLTPIADSVAKENRLEGSYFDFSVSSEDEIDYNTPTLFNNCANPITLSYVNSNITNNYTVENTDNAITYDGSLLKKCNILLSDLACNFSFTVYIENNLGQKFKCPVYISIPLENDSSSIYDGNYTYTYNPNYSFLMYE